MSELGLSPDEIIPEIASDYVTGYIMLSAACVVFYDTVLSLEQEVSCIWRRRFSVVTLLYIIVRYGALLAMALLTLDNLLLVGTVPVCRAFNIMHYACDVIHVSGVAGLNCLRVWAICQKKWAPVILVFILSIFTPCNNIYSYSRPQDFVVIRSKPFRGCWSVPLVSHYIYCTYLSSTDLAILVFTFVETADIIRTSRDLHVKTNVATLLVRNGSFQFVILLLLNLLSVILDALSLAVPLGKSSNTTYFIYINEGLTSIILAHFLLDLRSVYLKNGQLDADSSIQFSESILANMGASLNDAWVGDVMNRDSESETVLSDKPLSVGLLDSDIDHNTNDTGEQPESV
ncbi:hypothetical protein QCA50_008208 [Cerrena zonata]|uniref:DUF6533 domain-containing protein n=1 Tax=Cerrena zonata TaxID=2478898 RepID=A0AAW0GBY8_9APHY